MSRPGPDRSLFIMILIIIIIAVAIVLSINISAPSSGWRKGILTGNVTIGPLCPVEPCTVTPRPGSPLHMLHARLLFQYTGGGVIAEAVPGPV